MTKIVYSPNNEFALSEEICVKMKELGSDYVREKHGFLMADLKIPRHDPILVEVVEQIADSSLQVAEIKGSQYRIRSEWVAGSNGCDCCGHGIETIELPEQQVWIDASKPGKSVSPCWVEIMHICPEGDNTDDLYAQQDFLERKGGRR